MSTHDRTPHRHSLTYLRVKNPLHEVSDRFIDQQVIELWSHLMTGRHGFSILKRTPCVWMPSGECERQPLLMSRMKFQAAVTRLEYTTYDDTLGTTEIRTRFVGNTDLALVTQHLERHLAERSKATQLTQAPGIAISTFDPLLEEPLIDRLEAADHMALSCNIPRGLAPVRSEICS